MIVILNSKGLKLEVQIAYIITTLTFEYLLSPILLIITQIRVTF